MSRPSAEALLVSALINTGDVTQAAQIGIEPDMWRGYQAEYRWCLNFQQTYGTPPTKESLIHKFPGFPFTEHTDVRYLIEEVRYAHTKHSLTRSIRDAAAHVAEGDIDEAI